MKKLFLSYSLGELVAKGLNISLVLVLPFILTQIEYGRVTILVALEAVATVFVSCGGGPSFLRHYARLTKYHRQFFTSAFKGWFTYSVPATGLLTVVFFVLNLSANDLSYTATEVLLFSLYVFLGSARENIYSMLRVEKNLKLYLNLKIVTQVLRFVLTLYLAGQTQSASSYIYASTLSTVFGLLVITPYCMERLDKNCDRRATIGKQIIRFGMPVMLANMTGTFSVFSDRFMLEFLLDTKTAGIYSFISTFAGANFFLINMLSLTMMPGFFAFKDFHNDAKSYLLRYVALGFTLVTLSSLPLYFACHYIVATKLTSYSPGLQALVILQCKFCLVPFLLYGQNILLFLGRTKFILTGSVLSCLINLILNYYLIQSDGLAGAALATTLCDLVMIFCTSAIAFLELERQNRKVQTTAPSSVDNFFVEKNATVAQRSTMN